MEVFLQLKDLTIRSLTGDYKILFKRLEEFKSLDLDTNFTIVDRKVYDLYKNIPFFSKIKDPIFIDAAEENKTADMALKIIEKLLEKGIKRGQRVTAIGGGITQDVSTFVCSILFRGVKWNLIPTTLLAQSDSCIGGKSSLNFKSWKNLLGNFYPPEQIIISTDFLETLTDKEVRSGIGEMVKVHMLSGSDATDKMDGFLQNIDDSKVMEQAIHNSLLCKKTLIEEDEFDTGLRLKMNLGHTFGHAIEVASQYKIPHGLAINIGILIANKFSLENNLINSETFDKLDTYARKNLKESDYTSLDFDVFFSALRKDKKNKSEEYGFIIPTSYGEVEVKYFPMNETVDNQISSYMKDELGL